MPFKQWVWSSNLQRVTKKSTTPRGVVLFLRKQRRFERSNPTVRWTVGSQCAHWLILYLRRRRKCKRISSGSPKRALPQEGWCSFCVNKGDSEDQNPTVRWTVAQTVKKARNRQNQNDKRGYIHRCRNMVSFYVILSVSEGSSHLR